MLEAGFGQADASNWTGWIQAVVSVCHCSLCDSGTKPVVTKPAVTVR